MHWIFERIIVFLLVFALLAGFLIISAFPMIYSVRHEASNIRWITFAAFGIPALVLNFTFASTVYELARKPDSWRLFNLRRIIWQILLWTSYALGVSSACLLLYLTWAT